MPDIENLREKNAEAIRAAKAEREEIVERIYERSTRMRLDLGHFSPLEPPKYTTFDPRSGAVVTLSLEGLRRLDAITSELEQRRESAHEASIAAEEGGSS